MFIFTLDVAFTQIAKNIYREFIYAFFWRLMLPTPREAPIKLTYHGNHNNYHMFDINNC